MAKVKPDVDPWTQYWQRGGNASFLGNKSSLQHYQLRKFWFERVEELEPKQPILDVGTGNGIVPSWLAEYSQEHSVKLDVIGVDKAQIKPTDGLDLRSETPYEDFTLPSNKKFGAIFSNFGLEYGDLDKGVPHLYRNLKKGGHVAALLHSDNSVIVATSQSIYELLPSLIKQLKKSVQPLMKALLKSDSTPLTKSAQQAQAKLNQFVRKHKGQQAFERSNFVPAVKHILNAADNHNETEALKVFESYYNNLVNHKAQLATLMAALKQIGSAGELHSRFSSAGFKEVVVETVEFPQSGIVGYYLKAVK